MVKTSRPPDPQLPALTLGSRLPYNRAIRTAEFSGREAFWAVPKLSAVTRLSRRTQAILPSSLEHLRNSRSSSRSYNNAMKRTFVSTTVLAMILATASLAQSAPAGGSPAPAAAPAATTTTAPNGSSVKVGIIDIQQAIVGTNEGARDFDALQKKYEPKKNELANLNTDIENLKKQLTTQGDKMNEEALATLKKSIESKQRSLQRSLEDAQNEYQGQQNEIAQRILQKMAPVIDKYAKANGYGLLFDSSNPWPQGPLLWATQSVDLTKNIVDAYNAQSGVAPPPSTPAPKPAGAPGATTGKPVGSATPPATKPKPSTAAAKQ